MTDILRRQNIVLDPEYPPGNQYSINQPNPRLMPQMVRKAPSLADFLPSTVTPLAAPLPAAPTITPLAPGPSNFPGTRNIAPMPTAGQLIAPQTIAPPALARPTAQRPATPARIAAPAPYAFPTGGQRLQGYQAGSAQAGAISRAVADPQFIPGAGSGLISSSNGNAYSIRPPTTDERAAEVPQPAGYQPRTMFGLLAGLSIQQMARNNELRAQKLQISQDAEMRRLSNERARLGIDQQNANTAAARLEQDKFTPTHEEVKGPGDIEPRKALRLLNTRTGEVSIPAPPNAGPTFDQFKARVANMPEFKGADDDKLMRYWKGTHGGQ